MAWIKSYSCTNAAGTSPNEFWHGLMSDQDFSVPWPQNPLLRTFRFTGTPIENVQLRLGAELQKALRPVRPQINQALSLGVILASTKGMSNDFIWNPSSQTLQLDPLSPLLMDFIKLSELKVVRSLCVSNACSSTLGALALAQIWLKQGIEQVVVVAADAVTPFVLRGFQALKLISENGVRPFSEDRCGFYLGEAAAVILLTAAPSAGAIHLRPIGLDSEGSPVTRPSQSGLSLMRAALRIPQLREAPPQIIMAHGTGTLINDATEDQTFHTLFGVSSNPPLVTGTKWCVGHTLATSGALDLIAACEAIRRQELFPLKTTHTIDSKFRARYFTRNSTHTGSIKRIMVSSLGFGGMHASALVESERP